MKQPGIWIAEKQKYVESITWKPSGPFSAHVWADYKFAEEIETGRPARDLKAMLQTSNKTRLTKSGKKYLIIPFRHNVPGNEAHARAMPPEVYAAVSSADFRKSRVTGKTTRLNAKGAVVPQNVYHWGSRLMHEGQKLKEFHTSNPYDGMVRFNTSSGKQKSSAYLTFRVMMEGSMKWIVPAKPGAFILQKVVADIEPKAQAAFEKAMEIDTALP